LTYGIVKSLSFSLYFFAFGFSLYINKINIKKKKKKKKKKIIKKKKKLKNKFLQKKSKKKKKKKKHLYIDRDIVPL